MPRPERDYGLALRKDIEKVDRGIQSLHEKRLRLIKAYEAYVGKPYPANPRTRKRRQRRPPT